MSSALARLLVGGPRAIDGAMATELEARGHDIGGRLWSARVLADHPDAIREVHADYFRAGATVGISASYQVSRAGFVADGRTVDEADAALARSVTLVREARDIVAAERASAVAEGPTAPIDSPGLVAASIGPYGATRHDGSEYRGNYGVSHAVLAAFHRERLDVVAAAGPDLFAVETIPDVREAAAIVEALGDHPQIPAWISYSCTGGARTCAGQPFAEAVAVAASAPAVLAVGINCTAPEHVTDLLAAGGDALPYVVYPNAGQVWDAASETWDGTPAGAFPARLMATWVEAGAVLIGGCCGIGPRAVAGITAEVTALR